MGEQPGGSKLLRRRSHTARRRRPPGTSAPPRAALRLHVQATATDCTCPPPPPWRRALPSRAALRSAGGQPRRRARVQATAAGRACPPPATPRGVPGREDEQEALRRRPWRGAASGQFRGCVTRKKGWKKMRRGSLVFWHASNSEKGDDLCAICDDGGDVTCCDGVCKRSFHLADGNSERSKCREILRLSIEQAKMILAPDKDFICKNCKYQEHQCFACGKLGSSDLSSEAEVFQCEVDDCGHFYHLKCVAKLLYPDSEDEATLFEVQVAAREKFTCPVHECIVCTGGENKNDTEMQFAVCRRCPTAYHRKCLPSNIHFDAKEGPNGYPQRAWDTFVGPDGQVIHRDQILIYCMKHPIIEKLKTPKRNHIIFPDVKKIRVPKVIVGPHNEDNTPEEEELLEPEPSRYPPSEDNTPEDEEPLEPEPSRPPPSDSPLPDASDQNQCSCSSPIDSFAPGSLFTHPHPGTCGWLGD